MAGGSADYFTLKKLLKFSIFLTLFSLLVDSAFLKNVQNIDVQNFFTEVKKILEIDGNENSFPFELSPVSTLSFVFISLTIAMFLANVSAGFIKTQSEKILLELARSSDQVKSGKISVQISIFGLIALLPYLVFFLALGGFIYYQDVFIKPNFRQFEKLELALKEENKLRKNEGGIINVIEKQLVNFVKTNGTEAPYAVAFKCSSSFAIVIDKHPFILFAEGNEAYSIKSSDLFVEPNNNDSLNSNQLYFSYLLSEPHLIQETTYNSKTVTQSSPNFLNLSAKKDNFTLKFDINESKYRTFINQNKKNKIIKQSKEDAQTQNPYGDIRDPDLPKNSFIKIHLDADTGNTPPVKHKIALDIEEINKMCNLYNKLKESGND